jgi:hypothetical protein
MKIKQSQSKHCPQYAVSEGGWVAAYRDVLHDTELKWTRGLATAVVPHKVPTGNQALFVLSATLLPKTL